MNKMFQAAAVVLCFCPLISASTLLYNGDAGGPSGVFGVPGPLAALGNTATQTGNGSVLFDDFVVPAGGWDITGVFSNNQVPNLLP
jgi:hypothetical protein